LGSFASSASTPARALRLAARRRDQIGAQALFVLEQHLQEVLRHQPLMAFPQRQLLRRLQKPPRPFGVPLVVSSLA
jgi:hypothetical protein